MSWLGSKGKIAFRWDPRSERGEPSLAPVAEIRSSDRIVEDSRPYVASGERGSSLFVTRIGCEPNLATRKRGMKTELNTLRAATGKTQVSRLFLALSRSCVQQGVSGAFSPGFFPFPGQRASELA